MNSTHPIARVLRIALAGAGGALALGCWNVDTPSTNVAFDNAYPASAATPLLLYEAYWGNVTFAGPGSGVPPVPPGDASGPLTAIPASDNTAYAVLAPGWDPDASATPATFVVLQSRGGFAVHIDDTLHIPVDDTTFAGNCAAGSFLSQAQADFITQIVFPATFAGKRYDAASCTTTPIGDAGSE